MVARHRAASQRGGEALVRGVEQEPQRGRDGLAQRALGDRAQPVAAGREQRVAEAVAHRALHAAEVRALGGEHVIEAQLVQAARERSRRLHGGS
jgi:hypothetical protein